MPPSIRASLKQAGLQHPKGAHDGRGEIYLEGCCSKESHLITSNVDMLAGKQLQDLLQDRLQEVEGPIIPLLSNVSFDRYSSKDTLLELLEHILQAALAILL